MKRLWYYTSLEEMQKIILDGIIKLPEVSNLNGTFPSIGLSANPYWEIPPGRVSIDEILAQNRQNDFFVYARVEVFVDVEIINWETYKIQAGIPEEIYKEIELFAFEDEANPEDWFYSTKSIPKNKWGAIQYLDGYKWTLLSPYICPSVQTSMEKG